MCALGDVNDDHAAVTGLLQKAEKDGVGIRGVTRPEGLHDETAEGGLQQRFQGTERSWEDPDDRNFVAEFGADTEGVFR